MSERIFFVGQYSNHPGAHVSRPQRHVVALLAFTLLVFILYASRTAVASEPSPPVISAAEIDYPPFSIVDETGRADGFSVELLRAALAAMGRDVTFRTGPWGEVKGWLEKGDVQVLPLVGRTPEREELFDFTVPYMSLHGAIVVRSGTTDIHSLADLTGRRVAVMRGDNAEEFLRREERGILIQTAPSFEQALQELSQGRHDAVVVQRLVALRLIPKTGLDLLEFPTIIFFQCGYSVFTLRQASRRSWRIGQDQPVRVFFMAYADTMQEKALSLMAQKMETSLAIEGELSDKGLAALSESENSMTYELAKALTGKIAVKDMSEAWTRYRQRELLGNLSMDDDQAVTITTTTTMATSSGIATITQQYIVRGPVYVKKDGAVAYVGRNRFNLKEGVVFWSGRKIGCPTKTAIKSSILALKMPKRPNRRRFTHRRGMRWSRPATWKMILILLSVRPILCSKSSSKISRSSSR